MTSLHDAGDSQADISFIVGDVMTSSAGDVIVVRYHDSGLVGGAPRYVRVDLASGERMTISAGRLEDMSSDCRLGVDDQLVLYDLVAGRVLATVPYRDASSNTQLQVGHWLYSLSCWVPVFLFTRC